MNTNQANSAPQENSAPQATEATAGTAAQPARVHRRMKDFDPSEQPREKALAHGCRVLTIPELLALILRVGVTGMPIIDMCKELIDSNGGSLHMLARRTLPELQQTPGMGATKALQVQAIMELARRYYAEVEATNPKIIRSSRDIHEVMRFENANSPQEQIWLLTLSRRNAIIAKHHLTTGSAVASIFDIKRALKLALLDEANSIILCHNHPSGNLQPSPQDDRITQALKSAAAVMELTMLDHVIVSAEGYYSYADKGRL
jgi:DNA repair protein RadC